MSDYWSDTASEALEDAGIEATKEQTDTVAIWIESAHDHYGQAHGHDVMFKDAGPTKYELEKKIESLEYEIRQLTGDVNAFKNSVRRRLDCDQVWIESGAVMYS